MARIKDPDKLFDFINMMFTQNSDFDNLNNAQKSKHFFMVNRLMSIYFPKQAQLFNYVGMNQLGTIESWRLVAKRYKKVPGWIYTKINKKKTINTKKFDQEVIDEYIKINEIGIREFNDAMELEPELLENYLTKLTKHMEMISKRRKKNV